MTPWEALDTNPAFKGFVLSRGWTADEWNSAKPYGRAAEHIEFSGGLEETGILRELPGAIRETVGEQVAAVGSAVTSTGRAVNRGLFFGVVITLGVLAVVYREPISKLFRKGVK